MFETNLSKMQAKEICEMHINEVLDSEEEKELLGEHNPSLLKAYLALHEYAYA